MTPQEIVAALAAKMEKNDQRIKTLEGLTDEALANIARLTAGGVGDGSGRRDEAVEAHVKRFFALVQRTDVEHAVVDRQILAEYASGFGAYLRRGEQGVPAQFSAALRVGSDPAGGYWVTPQMGNTIIQRLFETSPMRGLANVIPITGDSIVWPTDTNDATSGGFVGEGDPRGETDTPEVGEQTIYVREQFAQPLASQKLLDMSGFDVEGWLGRKIGDKLGRVENTKFVSGTGVKEPRGFVDYGAAAVTTDDDGPRAWGVLQYVPTGAAAGFPTLSGGGDDPDALIDLQLKLKPEYLPGAVWAMRRSTAAVIRKLKDKDGRYIWLDNITEGGRPLLLGHPVTFLEDMPAVAANSFSVAFGNFNVGYQIVDGPAIRVLRDPFTTKGKVKFYTTKWTGGDVVNFDALKLLKFGTS